MKKYRLISVLFVTASLLFVGCKKDDPKKSPTDLITQESWKLVKDEERVGLSGTWTDYFPTYLTCEKDDETVFRSNSTYEINSGATKCDPSDPQVYQTGIWSFGAGSKINIDGQDAIVDQLDENTLVISSSDTTNNIVTYYRYQFSH